MSGRQLAMAKKRVEDGKQATIGRYEGVVDRSGPLGRWTGRLNYDAAALTRFFDQLRRARKPRFVFVNSMSDTFHKDVPPRSLIDLADAIRVVETNEGLAGASRKPWPHVIMLLTKRPDRLLAWQREHFPQGLPSWVWVGATMENQKRTDERAPVLAEVKTRGVRYGSFEPLLSAVDASEWLGPDGISWVVSGAESGTKARPMHPAWARGLRDQAQAADVACLHKQNGRWELRSRDDGRPFDTLAKHNRDRLVDIAGNVHCTVGAAGPTYVPMSRVTGKRSGRLIDGQLWNEFPEARP